MVQALVVKFIKENTPSTYMYIYKQILILCVCVYTKVKEKQKFFENPETDLWNLKYKPKVKLPEQQNVYVQEIKY